jgi:hypothetical protein
MGKKVMSFRFDFGKGDKRNLILLLAVAVSIRALTLSPRST